MKRNFKRTQLLKKSAAIGMAALLGVTAAPVSALAAETYNELAKESLAEFIDGFVAEYARSFEEYDALMSGEHMDMTLTLGEAGRSILGFVVPADISWFDNITISADQTLAEKSQFMNAGIYLNGTKLCSMEYLFDFETMDIYMKFPEFREGYLKMNYEESLKQQMAAIEAEMETIETEGELSEEDEAMLEVYEETYKELSSGLASPEFMKGITAVAGDFTEFMPEASVMEEILNRYGSIIFCNMEDGGVSEETITLDEITATCKVYEGTLSNEADDAMTKELFDTARTDEQLKDILNSWDEKLPQTENLYQSFLDMLDKGEESVMAAESDENLSFSFKIYVDENGEIVGKDFSFVEDGETTPFLSYITLKDNGSFESRLAFGPEDEGVVLTGIGTIDGTTLNGNYILDAEGTSVANIEVSNYDTEAMANGNFTGSYSISPIIEVDAAEGETYNPFANFEFLVDIISDRDSANMDFTLASAGAPLGKIAIETTLGVPVEKPDFKDLTDVYDMMDEASMNEYLSGMTFDVLLENVLAAGVPEDLINALLSGGEAPAEEFDGADSYDTAAEDAA